MWNITALTRYTCQLMEASRVEANTGRLMRRWSAPSLSGFVTFCTRPSRCTNLGSCIHIIVGAL